MNRLIATAVAATLMLAVAVPVHAEDLPPCPTEDSTGCYWDAETQGNGEGEDVVTPRQKEPDPGPTFVPPVIPIGDDITRDNPTVVVTENPGIPYRVDHTWYSVTTYYTYVETAPYVYSEPVITTIVRFWKIGLAQGWKTGLA
jgi:hypothetical protein